MTVSNNVNKAGPFVGDDAVTSFPFTYKVFADADLLVVRINADDSETTLVLNSDYTVTLNFNQDSSPGGSITYPLAGAELSTDEYLTIFREVDETQESDIANLGGFYPDIIENMADRNTMMSQQHHEELSRSLGMSRGATAAQIASMKIPASTRSKYLYVNSAGDFDYTQDELDAAQNTIDIAANTAAIANLSVVGGAIFPQTPDELTAGIVISDYSCRPGEVDRYVVNTVPLTTDVTVQLQAYFDFIWAYDVGTAVCNGDFLISAGLILGNTSPKSLTLYIDGRMHFKAANAIDTMLLFQNCRGMVVGGQITCEGTGGVQFASRTCRTGIRVGNTPAAAIRMEFNNLKCVHFYEWGVDCQTLTALTDLGNIQTEDCGSGQPSNPVYSLAGNWSNQVNSGLSASVGQLSTIDVDQMPPVDLIANPFVNINGEIYYVDSSDVGAGTLDVYPWIDSTLAGSGTFTYIFGGGLHIQGVDAGIIGANQISPTRCGIGYWDASLYGAQTSRVVNQYCGVGHMFGNTPTAAHIGGSINGLYSEANTFDIVRACRDVTGRIITNEYALNLGKVTYSCFPRATDDSIKVNMDGLVINYRGKMSEYISAPNGRISDTTSHSWDIFDPSSRWITRRRDVATIVLDDTNQALNPLYGFDSGQYNIIGTGTNSAPTGNITFTPPSGGKINGGVVDADAIFAGFTGTAIFIVQYDFTNDDYIVTCANLV